MIKLRELAQVIRKRRLLFSQIIFTVIAFVLMVVLSYLFVRGIVYDNLTRYSQSVFAAAQMQVEHDVEESASSLGAFALAVRSNILSGADIEIIRHLTYDMSDHLQAKRIEVPGFEDLVEDLFIYLEAYPGDPVIISGFGWVFPDNFDPAERLWYQAAMAANGDVTMTNPFTSLRSGETVITFTQCIFDDEGQLLGIAGLNIHIDEIGQNIVDMAVDYDGYGMLFARDLTIIAHANPEFIGMHVGDPALPVTAFANALLAGEDVVDDTFVNWKGEVTMAHVKQLPNGWYLGLLTPQGPFYRSIDEMMLILIILGSILAAALVLILIQIDRAKDKASEESRQKSAFLANMSHEIRTPLNAVIGLSELILDTAEWNSENEYRVEQIISAGETLLSTVNDILDISKIESGKFELIELDYDIPSILNDASTQSILHRGDKPIEFIMNINEELPTVLHGDELRIKQILNNLLSNAFKYTMSGTVTLTVKSEKDGDSVWLSFIVTDTGLGIKEDDLAVLFDDYAQVDMAANRKIVGTGLGLPITKRLVEQMHGKIKAESKYKDGSVFTVRIMQKHVTDEVIGAEIVDSLKNFHYSETKRRGFEALKRISLPYARVLIVDDVLTNLDVAKGLMKPYRMHVDCVTSGWEAVEAMHDNSIRYNAIFMDHMMPGMDGIEATKLIREIDSEYAKNIPIIALTANAIVGNEEMFLENGFQAFVSKPIEISRLDSVIREWVRDKEQEELYVRSGKSVEIEEAAESSTAGVLLIGEIPGVNVDRGLNRFSGDSDAYIDVLRSFAKNTPPLLDSLSEIADSGFHARPSEDRLPEYETIVHGIKGSSGSICAVKTADLALALENAARSGDYGYILINHLPFMNTARRLVSDIDAALVRVNEEKHKPVMDKPDPELLKILKDACSNYEMNVVDDILEKLEAREYETDGDLVVWLRENADQTNFDEIVERLSALDN